MLECWISNALLQCKIAPVSNFGEGTQIHQSWKEQDWLPCGLVLDVVPLPSTSEYSLPKKYAESVKYPLTAFWAHGSWIAIIKVVALLIYTKLVHESLIYPVLEICDSDSYAESRKAISGGVTRCLRFASEEATCRGASSHNAKRHFYPPWEGKSRF